MQKVTVIFNKTGERLERFPIDAAELVATGEYSYTGKQKPQSLPARDEAEFPHAIAEKPPTKAEREKQHDEETGANVSGNPERSAVTPSNPGAVRAAAVKTDADKAGKRP
jgi:hypothetical protein